MWVPKAGDSVPLRGSCVLGFLLGMNGGAGLRRAIRYSVNRCRVGGVLEAEWVAICIEHHDVPRGAPWATENENGTVSAWPWEWSQCRWERASSGTRCLMIWAAG